MFGFKKISAPSSIKEDITAYETWVVRWKSRYGSYSSDTKPEVEVFTSEEDACKFKQRLEEAFNLLRHTSGTKVTVTKNN